MKPVANNQGKINIWLMLALVVTIALTAWSALEPSEEEEASLLVEPSKVSHILPLQKQTNTQTISTTKAATVLPISSWQVLHREALTTKPKDLFAVHSWAEVVPAKKGKPLPPPPPVAPPAPFAYMGKIEDSPKGTLIFLMANNKVYSVALGEKIDSFWRLDAEAPESLTLTYLPLNLRQTLSKAQKLISAGLPNAAVGVDN